MRRSRVWFSEHISREAQKRLSGLFHRCNLKTSDVPNFWSSSTAVAPFLPLLTSDFHFEDHHFTTLGDVVIQQYVAEAIEDYFASRQLMATVQCATQLAACVQNHFSLRLCAQRLGFAELCAPESGEVTRKGSGLNFLEARRRIVSHHDTSGTSFAFAPIPCGQDSLGWKFSHFVGAVRVKFGKEAATEVVHQQLQLANGPNFPLAVATKVKEAVENYPITSVAEAILAAQGLTAAYSAKSMVVGSSAADGEPDGDGVPNDEAEVAQDEHETSADDAERARSDAGDSAGVVAAGTGGEPLQGLAQLGLSSIAAGPPHSDMLSNWKRRNAAVMGSQPGGGQGQVTTGWLGDEERRKARGPAEAHRIVFKTFFSDLYGLPQPEQGKWIYRRERKPVRDPQFYDKASSMRNGIPFDTRGLTVDEYVAKLCRQNERRFEVTMSVGYPKPTVVAKVITKSYTEGRVAASRIFLHRVVKDIEAVAANAAAPVN